MVSALTQLSIQLAFYNRRSQLKKCSFSTKTQSRFTSVVRMMGTAKKSAKHLRVSFFSEVPETKHKARLSAKTFDTTVMCIKMLMPWPKSKIAVLHQYQHFDWKSINISIGYKF